ncbi:dipeptidase [Paenibacillus sp. N1-5-1-14]|uniref:dipeptidase n=1 Tax=Paenibacillus radicibacter TaxID=2972488 RepID=UPI002159715E|nr:dipeptidase [Paenibacillus radicibacter]MCR8641881.1 dipeptidase [Paenibacillus radicibacter]
MDAILSYFKEHESRFLEELKQYLRIPSVSALSAHQSDMHACAKWTADSLRAAGMENVEVIETAGHPIVYADWLHAEGKPTILVYGHYDVQPAEPLDLWKSEPFEPEIRDGKIYARGATDDKGQLFIHAKVVEAWLHTYGKLPVNVKFCIEGEEEITSPNLPAFLEANKEKLSCDIVLISDGPMIADGQPSIEYGLRGVAGLEIHVQAANGDLHSGLFGGGVPNAIHALTDLLSSLHSADGSIAVEGFYEGIEPLSDEERHNFSMQPVDENQVKESLGLKALYGEEGYSFVERTTARPTLEITSVTGGFQGEGIKPIVPCQASAKIACRLVPPQKPDDILDKVERHIHEHCPTGVTVSVKKVLRGNPYMTPIDHPAVRAASDAYEKAYGKPAIYVRGGGSIPIVESFSRLLEASVVLMGFGLPGENLHAPNENFDLGNFAKGLETTSYYLQNVAELELK